MSLIGLLVVVIVLAVCYWAVMAILSASGIGEPVATIVKVVFVVIVLLWLLSALGVGTGLPSLRLH